jgi:4-amino-4-deoxy-L-arabinose transferase-like glycosyltransferase
MLSRAANHRKLFLLLTVALAIRLGVGWAWQSRIDGRFGMGDSESYWTLGRAIAEGKPYEYGAEGAQVFRTPGYPLLLAPIIGLVGDNLPAVLVARAEAALFGALAVAALWWLTRLLFDDRTALLAAAFATFYPGLIALSGLILSEAPFCPLMLLQFVCWTLACRAKTSTRTACLAFCGGLAAGAATLVRPSWFLFTPMAVAAEVLIGFCAARGLWSAAIHRRFRCVEGLAKAGSSPSTESDDESPHSKNVATRSVSPRHLTIAVCMMLGLIAAMLPWWIRNARVTGHFVPTTLQVGASLYDGLSPEATGASNMDFVAQFVEEQHLADQTQERLKDSFEVRLDRRLHDASVAWAKAHPGRVLELAGAKFLRMWNIWPNEPRLTSWYVRLVVIFTYPPLLLFAIIGAWRTIDWGWPYRLCWLPAVYFTMLHTVFVSSIRYREPAMLALLALAAAGVMGIWDRQREIRTQAKRDS